MTSEQVNEDEITFKKRARRRLVGAIALVLLMVTVLPMVLDDRNNQPTKPDIEITIPSESNQKDSEAFARKSMGAHLAEEKPELESPKPEAVQSAVMTSESKVDSEIALAKQAQQSQHVAAAGQPPEDATKKEPHAAVASSPQANSVMLEPANKPQTKIVPEKHQEPMPAVDTKVIDKKTETTANTSANTNAVWVQVGVFSNESKVHDLQTKLLSKGVHTVIEPIDTPKGKSYRLKTEHFPQREQAEKALEVLKTEGINGMIRAK